MNQHCLPDPQPRRSYAHINELGYQAVRRALFPVRRTRAIRRDARAYREAFEATTAKLVVEHTLFVADKGGRG